MRVHRIENVNKSLAFLHTKVKQVFVKFRFEGTVRVIPSDPKCKIGKVRFTTVPLKPLFD